jgi:ribosome maturation factor RimP
VSTTERQVEAVRDAIAPAVAARGLELYDVEFAGAGAGRTLRVTVRRDGGVDLDAITEVTRVVSPLLDAAGAVDGPYLLEVSSPGVERTLRTPAHFAGAVGERVSVKYHTAEGPRRSHGRLVEAGADRITVDAEGTVERVPLRDVTRARTVFEWGPQPRPGKAGATRARAKESR